MPSFPSCVFSRVGNQGPGGSRGGWDQNLTKYNCEALVSHVLSSGVEPRLYVLSSSDDIHENCVQGGTLQISNRTESHGRVQDIKMKRPVRDGELVQVLKHS